MRLRLRADVPVACYLSGGIDSCAVLGFASRLSSRPLRAYTLSFDHADYDESVIAEEQAQLSGAEFCRIDVRLRAPRRSLRRRDLSRRAAVRERARDREVPVEPGGARLGHQGRADRRRQRRDLRRLPALPARPGAARRQRRTTPPSRRGCSPSSRPPTACRLGLLMPQGSTPIDERAAACSASCRRTSRRGRRSAPACCAWRATSSRTRSPAATPSASC